MALSTLARPDLRSRSGRDHDVATELRRHLAILQQSARDFAEQRQETVKILRAIVKDLRTWHERARKAKVYGGGAGLAGAVLVLGGAMFPSLRVALRLGAVIGGLGTAVNVGGIVVDTWTSNSVAEEVKQILERDRKAFDQFVSVVERSKSSWFVNSAGIVSPAVTKLLGKVNKEVNPIESLFRFISAAGEELGVGSVVAGAALFTIAAVPLNLFSLITNVNTSDPKIVQAIDSVIKILECPGDEIQKALSCMVQ
ncbi:uncharacterized protein LOC110987707 [Acanthaster planci]|uniref:Uncharacterized protein LOC110987707 n=1 Tax=Acanthaster planci TaxID=133434 RepID=A0A8B7ZNB5_ACAPL|nr:uncharacterized protein LOC110987707 [Acanthaster planci]XP_022106391.1 uncharacterized protein LOC110987707 [Acanthaster planci]